METIKCHILIAGSTPKFRGLIKAIVKEEEMQSGFSFSVLEATTTDELETGFDVHTNVAFVDAAFFRRGDKRLSGIWKKARPDCVFALLLSGDAPVDLKTAILSIEKQKKLPLNVHILKDNYPDDLVRRVVLRMIELACDQLNMAVV